MKQSKISIYIDLFFCLIVLPISLLLVPVDKLIIYRPDFFVAFLIYIYGLYFLYRKIKLPFLFMQKKYWQMLLFIFALLLVTFCFAKFPFPPTEKEISNFMIQARQRMLQHIVWLFYLIITGFSLSIELIFEIFRQLLLKQEIETQKNKSELSLYKAQINPHFLFNTLNTLYGLVITKSEKTESAFVKFSDILKYMYSYANVDYISLEREIEYIQQYVDLQMLRLNKHTGITFKTHLDEKHWQIPPMILISFVENAFKYGTSASENCCIYIQLKVEKGEMLFEIENNVMKQRKDEMPGIGIKNCRKRLELLYPNKFTLMAEEKEKKFRVCLKICLR